jgi:hypothetical protein
MDTKEDYSPPGWNPETDSAPCLGCPNYPPQDDTIGMKDICALRCVARVMWIAITAQDSFFFEERRR